MFTLGRKKERLPYRFAQLTLLRYRQNNPYLWLQKQVLPLATSAKQVNPTCAIYLLRTNRTSKMQLFLFWVPIARNLLNHFKKSKIKSCRGNQFTLLGNMLSFRG